MSDEEYPIEDPRQWWGYDFVFHFEVSAEYDCSWRDLLRYCWGRNQAEVLGTVVGAVDVRREEILVEADSGDRRFALGKEGIHHWDASCLDESQERREDGSQEEIGRWEL